MIWSLKLDNESDMADDVMEVSTPIWVPIVNVTLSSVMSCAENVAPVRTVLVSEYGSMNSYC